MNDYKVKGTSIKSKMDFIAKMFGENAIIQFKKNFEDSAMFPLLDSNWYDYNLYIDILKYIVLNFYNNDIQKLENVGMFSAESVLMGVYKVYIQQQNYINFLKRISTLHSRFYSVGEMIVDIGKNKKSAKIVLRGAPEYAREDDYIASGFYMKSAYMCGKENVQCSIRRLNNSTEFFVSWS